MLTARDFLVAGANQSAGEGVQTQTAIDVFRVKRDGLTSALPKREARSRNTRPTSWLPSRRRAGVYHLASPVESGCWTSLTPRRTLQWAHAAPPLTQTQVAQQRL
jgi:hypothetical protein